MDACEESDAGPSVARNHWLGEHQRLAAEAFLRAGIPVLMLEPMEMSVYTDGEDIEQLGNPVPAVPELPSWQPAELDEITTRIAHSRPL